MYLLNPLARVSCLVCLPPLYFVVGKIYTTQQSLFDLQCNLPDAISDYYNCNDANGEGDSTIRWRSLCAFNLLIDVRSRFVL